MPINLNKNEVAGSDILIAYRDGLHKRVSEQITRHRSLNPDATNHDIRDLCRSHEVRDMLILDVSKETKVDVSKETKVALIESLDSELRAMLG